MKQITLREIDNYQIFLLNFFFKHYNNFMFIIKSIFDILYYVSSLQNCENKLLNRIIVEFIKILTQERCNNKQYIL